MLLGILGFFTLMALIQAVHAEVTGQDAAMSAVVLLAFLVPTALVWRARRRLPV